MTLTLLVLALATFASTYFGGFFALWAKDKLHVITGFSAGAVIGVAFFDLLPEALEASGNKDVSAVIGTVALGFILYLILDRIVGLHAHHEESHDSEAHIETETHRGVLRASSLSFHSLLDGVAIGLSFHVSVAMGIVVAVAVLAHDFSDGINTVTAIVKGGGTRKNAFRWLLVDALAPAIGIIITLFISVSTTSLAGFLAIFSGFFLYIGASDLVPESYHAHPTKWTTVATILGALFIYFAITLAK